MDTFLQDLRYATRSFLAAPAFTIVAVLTLAIGIGANTAIFTLVHAVLLEPLPFKDADRLVAVWEESARRPGRPNVVAPANFLRWTDRAQSFESLAAFADTRATLNGDGDPEEVVVENVSASFFTTFGVGPLIGRSFSAEETTTPDANVAILSYRLWQRRFASDPAVVGRSVQLSARPTTIVGVMPPDFTVLFRNGSLVGKPADLWVPYVLPASARQPRGRFASVVGRLKPGSSVAQASAELNAIMGDLAREFPQFDTGWSVDVLPLRDELSGQFRPALLVLFGAVGFVLLIACANVANLLLARGVLRQRELAIRAALGAGRARVVRQLFTETLLLAVAGAAAGLLLARWMIAGLTALSPVDLATAGSLPLNRAVLLFTAAVAMLTTGLAGLAPALEGTKVDVGEAIHDGARLAGGGPRARRLRDAFVIAEVALAVVLLVGAGLLLRSFESLRGVNPGFDASNVLTMRLQLPAARYPDDDQRTRFFTQAVSRVGALPGIQVAGAVSYLPFAGLGAGTKFTIEGEPPPPPGQDLVTDVEVCDNGYLRAMRIPLVQGRWFSDRELVERSNVVIVSEALVRRYFPGEDPIGKRLNISMTDPIVPTEIIGVVGDVQFANLATPARPTSYWPHPQLPYPAMTLTLRTAGDPLPVAPAVAREIRAIDPGQPVADVRTMDQWVGRSVSQARFTATLLATFAGIALLLAAVGLYAVIAYVVTQRTNEIGVRMALGAVAGDIAGMVVADGLRLAGAGLLIGVALALGLTRAISALLFNTRATDPLTFAGVVALLATVAAAASYIPARRAAAIEPVQALRAE